MAAFLRFANKTQGFHTKFTLFWQNQYGKIVPEKKKYIDLTAFIIYNSFVYSFFTVIHFIGGYLVTT